ncbi:cytochrome-c peroxidase [Leucothrix arctica]|uniref:Methylamine utilization protein MauG n=1 Tax=Leucothrix arctica TaxID=1481894 RepID=A0A317CL97_9GAMM|nr:cytochrome c peroxidase [Leucothrix arctica]PWQ99364.1 methylamine utilization protein MauG [Leucothrix arctica]
MSQRQSWRACALVLLACFSNNVIAADNATALPQPLTDNDYRTVNLNAAKLGQQLFYDKILSGNKNIACSTCHHHDLASGDGLSLGVGEGGIGLGEKRIVGEGNSRIKRRVPRNATPLFNLGAKQFTHLFHDGRVSVDPIFPSGFNTPAEEFLPKGLESLLAAQALFPVTSAVEMAGERNENQIAGATRRRPDYVWAILEKRLQGIYSYEQLFKDAYPEQVKQSSDINIIQMGNALAAFIEHEWRADSSPFDAFVSGDSDALNEKQTQGMKLFYGKAECSSCHSGALQTDHDFHAIMLPSFGPGRTRRFEHIARDRGRINETDRLEDSYRFRTPSLRNVAATGPYGHNGAYSSLEGIIRHHIDPVKSIENYDASQLVMPQDEYLVKNDFLIQQDKRETASLKRYRDIDLPALTDLEIEQVIAFLEALTDEKSLYGRLGAPSQVPSKIAVD